MNNLSLVVSLSNELIRLDKYIGSLEITELSRSRLKTGLKKLSVNGKNVKLSTKVKNGDKIELAWENAIPTDIEAENIPLEILYDDANVTVVNKEQGMVTHPASGNWNGTLVNALLYFWSEQNKLIETKVKVNKENLQANSLRPGIIHRLDKDTSGLIITAKNPETETYLQNQFRNHRVKKEYICIVHGTPENNHGNIKTQIIRDPKNRKRFTTTENKNQGKFAHTVYSCFAYYGPYSLMHVRLKTGRTHQIRVHMKSIGCPIVGDPIYNNKNDKLFSSAKLMLHSRHLSIRLPNCDEFTKFSAPVPRRFKKVLKTLHEKYEKITIRN
ncbi:MAG: RluA family pseudouridine synthase [Treponema sp.]|nr:RluA family pseudouridine synthase [Treponema sp.]